MPLQTNGIATANASLNGGSMTSLPAGASVKWSSSDFGIATVQQSSVNPLQASISPVAPGQCTITCTVINADGSSVSGFASETVVAPPAPGVTSVSVSLAEQNPA